MAYIGQGLDSDIQVNKYEYTATAGQTIFACTYDRAVDVYVNGVKLDSSDFTATNGTSITLASGANVGDIVDINAYFDVTYGGYDDTQIDALVDGVLPSQTGNADKYLKTNGTLASWADVSGGATGGSTDKIFVENDTVVTTDYTLARNASSVGPVTVNDGITLTVNSGVNWVVL